MNTATVLTDTDMLRQHARDLQYIGDMVDSGAAALGETIDAEHWVNKLDWLVFDGRIGPALAAFVGEFKQAHGESRARIRELANIYYTAAMGLRFVADHYDLADR